MKNRFLKEIGNGERRREEEGRMGWEGKRNKGKRRERGGKGRGKVRKRRE